ncbi:hypothetical protein [Streptomyces sp. NPDC092903]|uniref:hypothetical protein n=1 Tax=Streptomyces sp. NPDC092903 TaxID=3366017 RepID=UPI0037FEB315
MSAPLGSAEGIWIPAERARRGGVYLGAFLAFCVGLVILEALIMFVVLVLIEGEGLGAMGWAGVYGYLGLPVIAAVVSLPPMFAIVWRHPSLRIDSTGMSKVWRHRTQTVRWADLDTVRFNSRRSYLMLVVKAGAPPGRPNAAGGRRTLVMCSIGHAVWRRRRPGQAELILDAIKCFAPGKYTAEPWNPGKGRANGADAPA